MDAMSETGAVRKTPRRRWWIWLTGGVVCALLGLTLAGWAKYKYLRAHADDLLRDRVVASLSARFHSPVTLDSLHLEVGDGVHVSGTGLKILYVAGPARPDANPNSPPPMVSVASFEFQTDFRELFQPTTRIVTVFVRGLELNIPPHGMKNGAPTQDNPKRQGQPKVSLVFGKIVCTDSRLVIETSKPGKLPLVFNIANLTLTDVGAKKPLAYDATLTNPRPVGNVRATGHFGPWQADEPRDTAIDGNYWFTHADLSSFKGIAGILSSTGHFNGTLGQIDVQGKTDTPDFRLDISGHPVALHTEFVARVDGVTGDTTLNRVDATLLHSVLHASGSVYRVGDPTTGVTGHDTELSVRMDQGRIEDMLTLAVKTAPPILRGAMTMQNKLSLPPGKESVAKKIRLGGSFTIREATFGNPHIQETVDNLSMRAQGHPRDANDASAQRVESTFTGDFTQANAVLNLSNLQYTMPGAVVKLAGQYSLDGQRFEFHGVVRTEATASQMTTGWKSMLLKAIDPLLKKDGAGLEVPITVSGTKSDPKFGVDVKKLFQ